MKRKKLLTHSFFVCFLLVNFQVSSFAQSDDENDGLGNDLTVEQNIENEAEELGDDITTSSNPFQIQIKLGTQSPWTKSVPVQVIFTPNQDSSRVQISWDAPFGVRVEKSYEDYFPAKKGQAYTRTATIIPEKPGSYNIVANVTDWGYGANFTSSSRITVKFAEDLVTDPQTEGYAQSQMIKLAVILISLVLLVVGSIFGLKKLIPKIQEWFKPPQ